MLNIREKLKGLPRLYETENQDPIVRMRFDDPFSAWSWYPIEYDGKDTMFCFVDGFEKELGYVSVSELLSSVRTLRYTKIRSKLSSVKKPVRMIYNWLLV